LAERRERALLDAQTKLEAARIRSEDHRFSTEQRAAADRDANATRQLIASLAAARQGDKQAEKEWNDVEKLSRRMEPLTAMINTAQQVQDMLDSYKDSNTGKTKSIPGVGMLVGSLPQGMLTTEGSTNRQKVQMFANGMLRAQAGLSQTLTEQERADLELLAKGQFRQEQFEKAWPNLMKKINSHTDSVAGGYTPKVKELYQSQYPEGLMRVGPKTAKTNRSGPVTPAAAGEKTFNPVTGRLE
jgi:uncharacterized protein YifE (UPF0438 family)